MEATLQGVYDAFKTGGFSDDQIQVAVRDKECEINKSVFSYTLFFAARKRCAWRKSIGGSLFFERKS